MAAIRRAYLLKSLRFYDFREFGLSSAYKQKQLQEPGESLPLDFPAREKLFSVGYLTFEDIEGASLRELERAGLGQHEAGAVLAALTEREI